MSQFTVISKFTVRHPYYRDGMCRDIGVSPSPETLSLMNRRGYLLKQTGVAEWSVLDMQGNGSVAGDKLSFLVNIEKDILNYITTAGLIVPGKAISLFIDSSVPAVNLADMDLNYIDSRPGVFLIITFVLNGNQVNTPPTTEIRLPVAQYYWEYMFLFRQADGNQMLSLVDNIGSVAFDEGEKCEYLNHRSIRFRSRSKITCCEDYPVKLVLTETIRERKRELMNNISFPEPGNYLDAPPDVLRQVIYL